MMRRRALAKAVTYRLLGTAMTYLAALLVTGEWAMAGAVGGAEFGLKLVAYYLHERAWDRTTDAA